MKTPRPILPDLTLEKIKAMMVAAGVKRLLIKNLAPNDNSKNQPYMSKNEMAAFNILPAGEFYVEVSRDGRDILKAPFPLQWLQEDGTCNQAPEAKLIYYPQYPEVRLSGFLKGAVGAPNYLLNTRAEGRLLLLGITGDRRVIGWAAGPDSQIAQSVRAMAALETEGVFRVLPLKRTSAADSLAILLAELRRIHRLGWIESKRMAGGIVRPYRAQNGIGYTLEAELGVSNNGVAEPDFEGWEVKANKVDNYVRIPPAKASTLMTPEPDGGQYKALSFAEFIRTYGYPDQNGIADRMNFGGQFRVGRRHELTGLTMKLVGFDSISSEITDVAGKLSLVNDAGVEVSSWTFAKLLTIWNIKHAKAVYVPGEMQDHPVRSYRYAPTVLLGEGTDFEIFLAAVAHGYVIYDPGLKLENASTPAAARKKRNQFRIQWQHIPQLYKRMTSQNLL